MNEKTSIRIRKANKKDIPELIYLLQILFTIEEDFNFDISKHKKGLKLMLSDKNRCCILVAEYQEKVVGMCTSQLLCSTAEGGLIALIEDMVIKKEYRRQGMGKLLLTAIEKWSLDKNAKRIQLLADRNNVPALEFYKKVNWDLTQLICLHKKI
ncbi:MAG: GNAT family N-acetyltransferase [Bacillota bacterium]